MTDIEIPLGKRTKKYRFFEMLPGLLSYSLLILPILLSLFNQFLAASFIIVYIIMWFVKAVAMSYRTIQGYQTLEQAQKVDWLKRLNELEDPSKSLQKYDEQNTSKEWRIDRHIANLKRSTEQSEKYLKPTEVYNAVIIATYNEVRAVLEPTIESVTMSHYNLKNMILILAYEEKGGAETKKLVHDLIKEYGNKFLYAEAVEHPHNIPHEVSGKGGNITFAGKRLQQVLQEKSIDPNNVVVTTLDADNRPHPSYFAYLTYEYALNPDRRNYAFQPIALFLNNIWDVPAPMRVLATGNSFWTIINSLRPHMLRNFASHSQGMAALIDTKFWSVRTIVEDGHQFWRSYFRYDGQYEVTPIYVPIYQDAVLSDTYVKTFKAQFVQLRRWAYGASDIAYVADKGFRKDCKVPKFDLYSKFFRLLESHVSWATSSIILAFGAWAPLLINPESSRSIVAHQLPLIASQMQQFATIGILITVYLAFKMLPPRPARYKARRNVFMLAQWLLMPVVSLAYGSAAAFYSQTRLLTGRYLDKFDVTEKVVRTNDA